MRYVTTDPITGNDVSDIESAPFVIEGSGEDALEIYFESEQSRSDYMEIGVETPGPAILRAYNGTTDKSMEM